jgi:hypothetical protein
MQTKQQEANVEYLKKSIHGLIGEYEDAHSLLNEQMQAVIQNDISSLNTLIEKQTVAYESLKKSEMDFKEQLQVLHHPDPKTTKISLPRVIKQLQKPSETLNVLRDRLNTQVRKTEKLRTQLIDLLSFAQDQNADVFKAICDLASDNSNAYDAEGQKMQQSRNGLAVNQKA